MSKINNDFIDIDYIKNELKEVYSTNEVKTNKIWINGKTIYRKVYPFTLSNNIPADNAIGLMPNNYEQTIKLYGVVNASNNQIPIPISWNEVWDCGIMVQNNRIYIRSTWGMFAGLSGYAVVEYTKTTD